MKLVTTKFKSEGLHEKHVVATWNLGNHLIICFLAQGNQENPVSRWPVAGPSEYWLLASSPASKVKKQHCPYIYMYMPLSHSSHMCCHNSWNGKEQRRTTGNKWNFQFFFCCFWKLIAFSFMGLKHDSNVSHMLKNKRISTVKQCTHAGCSKRLINVHSTSFSAIIWQNYCKILGGKPFLRSLLRARRIWKDNFLLLVCNLRVILTDNQTGM